MKQYSKAIGSILGGLVGIAAGYGLDMAWATPEVISIVAVFFGGLIGTYVAPPNEI